MTDRNTKNGINAKEGGRVGGEVGGEGAIEEVPEGMEEVHGEEFEADGETKEEEGDGGEG